MRVRFLPALLAALLGAACALAPAFVSTPSVLEASSAVGLSGSSRLRDLMVTLD